MQITITTYTYKEKTELQAVWKMGDTEAKTTALVPEGLELPAHPQGPCEQGRDGPARSLPRRGPGPRPNQNQVQKVHQLAYTAGCASFS